ncbi:hypothetical protein LTR08_008234 [Meristemomyces frigidus]|nr:hypothetical protein LTR08_008234 [Meristemomyces frigidus]
MNSANHIRVYESEAFNFSARPVVINISGRRYLSNSGRLFYVHPNVLRSSSQYFRELIPVNGHNHEQRIEVPETDVQTFGRYSHFLYFGKIPSRLKNDGDYDDSEYEELFRLYMFANVAKDSVVMNATIGATLSRSTEIDGLGMHYLPQCLAITRAYRYSTDNSPLRRLVVDICVWFGDEDVIGNADDEGAIPAVVSICDYHDAGDCEACMDKKRKRADTGK